MRSVSDLPESHFEIILPPLDERGRYLAAKTLVEVKGLEWTEARDLVSRQPTLVPCGPDAEKAHRLHRALASAGIKAPIQEVDPETLRRQLSILTGLPPAPRRSGSTRLRKFLIWALALYVVPFLVFKAVTWIGAREEQLVPDLGGQSLLSLEPSGNMSLQVSRGPTAITVRNTGTTSWQMCSASLNDYYFRKFDALPAGGTVQLSLD
ncbi:MAG: hypothetical protein HY660_16765, partial [Armatimonadetes bacterium]|nr:hypothetical protein [Armatimonadota bacterium]